MNRRLKQKLSIILACIGITSIVSTITTCVYSHYLSETNTKTNTKVFAQKQASSTSSSDEKSYKITSSNSVKLDLDSGETKFKIKASRGGNAAYSPRGSLLFGEVKEKDSKKYESTVLYLDLDGKLKWYFKTNWLGKSYHVDNGSSSNSYFVVLYKSWTDKGYVICSFREGSGILLGGINMSSICTDYENKTMSKINDRCFMVMPRYEQAEVSTIFSSSYLFMFGDRGYYSTYVPLGGHYTGNNTVFAPLLSVATIHDSVNNKNYLVLFGAVKNYFNKPEEPAYNDAVLYIYEYVDNTWTWKHEMVEENCINRGITQANLDTGIYCSTQQMMISMKDNKIRTAAIYASCYDWIITSEWDTTDFSKSTHTKIDIQHGGYPSDDEIDLDFSKYFNVNGSRGYDMPSYYGTKDEKLYGGITHKTSSWDLNASTSDLMNPKKWSVPGSDNAVFRSTPNLDIGINGHSDKTIIGSPNEDGNYRIFDTSGNVWFFNRQANNGESGFDYSTRLKNDAIEVPGVSLDKSNNILDPEELKRKVNADLIKQNLLDYREDFDYSFKDPKIKTTNDDIYAGKVRTDLTITNSYEKGIWKRSFDINDVVLSGWYKWVTKQVNTNIDIAGSTLATKVIGDVDKDEIRKYVFDNINKFYSDTPIDLNETDINVDIKLANAETSSEQGKLVADISLQKYVNEKSLLTKSSLTKQFVLRGFKNVSETKWTNNSTDIDISSTEFASSPLNGMSAWWVNEWALKNLIQSKLDYFFTGYPSGSSSGASNIVVSNVVNSGVDGTVSFNLSLRNANNKYGKFTDSTLPTKRFTVRGLVRSQKTEITKIADGGVKGYLPSSINGDNVSKLINVNQQITPILIKGKRYGCASKEWLINLLRNYGESNLVDSTGASINLDTVLGDDLGSTKFYPKSFSPTVTIYKKIGDKNLFGYSFNKKDDDLGTINFKVTVNDVLFDEHGLIKEPSTTKEFTVSGLVKGPTSWTTNSTTININNAEWKDSPIKGMSAYWVNELSLRNFVLDRYKYFFKNLSKDFTSSNWVISDIRRNCLEGSVSFKLSLKKMYDECNKIDSTIGSKTFIITGLSKTTQTLLSEKKSIPASLKNKKASEVKQSELKNYLTTNMQATQVLRENVLMGADNKEELENSYKNIPNSSCYEKDSNVSKDFWNFVDGGATSKGKKEPFNNSYLIKKAIYKHIGNDTDFNYEIIKSNDFEGTLRVRARTNIGAFNSNGEFVKNYVTPEIVIRGFKTISTSIKKNVFNYDEIFDSKAKDKTVLSSTLNESYIKNAIVSKQNNIFNNLKEPLNASDISLSNIELVKTIEAVANGRLKFTITLPASKSTITTPIEITVNGFDKYTTSLINNDGVYDLGNMNLSSGQIDQETFRNEIKVHSKNIIKNLPKDYNFDSNVNIVPSSFKNTVIGEVSATVRFNNVYTPSKYIEKTIKFTGYKTDGLNTIINNRINIDLPEVLASKANENKSQIINSIIANDLVDKIVAGKILSNEDIDLSFTDANDVTGEAKANITINNKKAWESGNPLTSKTFNNITLIGFKKLEATSYANDRVVNASSVFSHTVADNDVTYDTIKDYITRNKSSFFVALPSGVTKDNILLKNVDYHTSSGQIEFKIELNKFLDRTTGKMINPSDHKILSSNTTFRITGFKTDGLTTKMNPAKTSFALDGVSDLLASDFNKNKNTIISALLPQIKANVQYLNKEISSSTLTNGDIDLRLAERDINNESGTIRVIITIKNNKAWVSGRGVAEFNFNNTAYNLTGFRTRGLTTQMNPSKTSFALSGVNNLVASDFDRNKSLIIDKLLPLLNENITSLNDTISPTSLTNRDVDINLSEMNINNEQGLVRVHIAIKNNKAWVNGIPLSSFNFNNATYTLTGFKTDGLNTMINPSKTRFNLDGINDILPSEFIENKTRIINALLPQIKSNIQGLANCAAASTLTNDDINLHLVDREVNNTIGALRVQIIIKNNKAWIDGRAVYTYNFNDAIYVLNGFKKQPMTDLKISKINAASFAHLNASQFKSENAQVLIQNNLNSLFTGLPEPRPNVIITKPLVINKTNGTATVKFNLSSYYNAFGRFKNELSREYTLKIEGFNCSSTSLVSNEIIVPLEANNLYSTDSSINAQWIKSKLRQDMFKNLRPGFNINEHVNISDVKNSWSDETVPFGKVKFKITINHAITDDGTDSKTFKNVYMSGFKTSDATTSQLVNEFTDSSLSEKIAMDIKNNFAINKSTLVDRILAANRNTPLFKNLIPGVNLLKDDINLSSATSCNHLDGSLVVHGSISKNKAWSNGLKRDFEFTIKIKGFKQFKKTTFKSNEVLDNTLSEVPAETWNSETAKSYVLAHKERFFLNAPDLSDAEINVRLIPSSVKCSQVNIEVSLARHYDKDGFEQTGECKQEFIIKGFKYVNVEKTLVKSTATKTLSSYAFNDFWKNSSKFVADIISPTNIQKNQEELKLWLSNPRNARKIFSNYAIDTAETSIGNVSLAFKTKTSLSVYIELLNASLGNGLFGKSIFTTSINGLKATPSIYLGKTSGLSQAVFDKLIDAFGSNEEEFKNELATGIYWGIERQIQSADFPEILREHFASNKTRKDTIDKIANSIVTSGKPITRAELDQNLIKTFFPSIEMPSYQWIGTTKLPEDINLGTSQFNNWVLIALIAGASLSLIVLISLLAVYFKKNNRYKEQESANFVADYN